MGLIARDDTRTRILRRPGAVITEEWWTVTSEATEDDLPGRGTAHPDNAAAVVESARIVGKVGVSARWAVIVYIDRTAWSE